MADAARLSQLVGAGGRTTGLEAFGQAVQETLGQHPDLGSEACWQQFGRLIAEHWVGLCSEQPALSTWGMIVKCSEVITRLRRAQGQERGNAAQDDLEAFRAMMQGVLEPDDDRNGP